MRFASSLLVVLAAACQADPTPVYVTHEGDVIYQIPPTESTSPTITDTGPVYTNRPETTVSSEDLQIDVFGVDGNRYWLGVSEEERLAANDDWAQGGGWWGGIYELEGGGTSTDDLVVVDAVSGDAASFGQVEFHLAGQSTGVFWESNTIPNLFLDTDQYQDGLTIGETEYLRFNNGQVGSIFREAMALQVFSALDFPAPRTSFAWVESNVWGNDTRVPYTVVEPYKQDWCDDHQAQLGGGCVNMWETWGDVTPPFLAGLSDSCQLSACENTRLTELSELVWNTPLGDGFMEATASHVEWSSIHKLQCLSWVLWTGDDPFHNLNNLVLVEQQNGKFSMLPYSTDISAGQEWYQFTPLYGTSSLAFGCQTDAECWAETVATCEEVIDDFQALDPAVTVVDAVYNRLSAQGMLRDGDEGRYTSIRQWYADRSTEGVLEAELELYRAPYEPCAGADTGNVLYGGGGYGGYYSPCY